MRLILAVLSKTCCQWGNTEMIGRKLHLNPIFRQLKRAEHHSCIISVEQKRIPQGLIQCKEESYNWRVCNIHTLEINLTKAKETFIYIKESQA
jgi:hypothetical protein